MRMVALPMIDLYNNDRYASVQCDHIHVSDLDGLLTKQIIMLAATILLE